MESKMIPFVAFTAILLVASLASAEPSIQDIADNNGLDIGAETGLQTIAVTPGTTHNVILIAEYAGMGDSTSGGWYIAGEPESRFVLFNGPDSPVINATFTVPDGVTEIGFFIQPGWYPGTYWYSETQYNTDKTDHVEIYPEENSDGYLIGFEDLPNGGDWDYNDQVILFGPPAPEFMFAVMPVGIILFILLFSYNAAKKNY